VIVGASLAVVSLAVIGYCALGVLRAFKGLTKEVARAGKALAEAAAPVQAGIARAQAGNGGRPGSTPADR